MKYIRVILSFLSSNWTKFIVTIVAVVAVGVRFFFPELKIDAITLTLIGLALLPWLASWLKSIEVPLIGKLEFQENKASSENQTARNQQSSGEEVVTDDQRLGRQEEDVSLSAAISKNIDHVSQLDGATTTCIQNGIMHFVLTSSGEFVGGRAALRGLCLRLLDGNWDGQIQVHHAFVDNLQREVDDLLAKPGLSLEEAQKLEQMRPHASVLARYVEVVSLSTRLTFMPGPYREPTWGVPMNTELAVDFMIGLFAETHLVPKNTSCAVKCQLYVPECINNPVAAAVFLCEDDVTEFEQSWEEELRQYDGSRWKTWGWSTLIPLWHLRDAFIATRLLPAISVNLAARVNLTPHQTIADTWEQLAQVYSSSKKRDVLVPYHWCLALRSDKSAKDLAWSTSPPRERSELLNVLGWQR